MEAKSLGHFFVVYQRFAAAENKSERTIEAVTAAVAHFDNFLGGCPDIGQVRAEDLRRYILSLQTRERWAGHPTIKTAHGSLSPHSIASYIRSIRSFWSWLKREEFIDKNPFENVRPPKAPRKIVNTLSPKQVTQLLNAISHKDGAGYRDRAIVITLYGTGLRVGELLGLRLDDINFDTGQIRVMGKGRRERFVYMSATVHKVLFKYLWHWRPKVPAEHLLVHDSGRPLSRFYVEHRLQAYGRKAGISGARCTPHTLRHTFAVEYLRGGADTFTLQRILGHSTLEMTRHYAEVSDGDVEIKQKMFSPAERLEIKV